MKNTLTRLGCLLCLSINTHAYSQDLLIESAPLSVEDDGTRKIIDRNEGESPPVENIFEMIVQPPVAEALMTPNDDVLNPPLAEQSDPISQKSPSVDLLRLDETPEAVVLSSTNDDMFLEYVPPLGNYLQYTFGYLNSQYKKIHSSLDNGSTITSLKFVSDISKHYQLGFGVEILNDKSSEMIPDSIRVLQYRLFFDYHTSIVTQGFLKLDWVTGFGFSVGDYGIKKRYNNFLGQKASLTIKEGMIVGLIPVAGLRFYLFDKNSFDLMIEYHQYFTKPQRYIGGLAIAPRFSFLF